VRAVRGEARRFWHGPGGGREVLQVGAPLILSHLSFTAQIFLDRLFLTWYAAEAVAGAVTGIFVVYSVVGLCVGTGEYATTFIAQYLGAGRPRRVGAAVWQGVYFALLAGAVIASLHPLLGPLFRAAGHQPLVQAYEHEYARIMMLGAAAPVLMATLSSFFAGRGRTVTVLLVNLAAGALDAFLNWAWIFGHFGFPRWGVSGAAWSSVLAQGFGAALYLAIVLRREHRERFATLAAWRFEAPLFRRLLRYGLPAGLQYSMEVAAFAVFMIVVGRIGTAELAASGIAFNLNMIVFMPMLGLGLAVSSLVGRHLGADHPQAAERVVWSAFALSLAFMTACGLLYVLAPRLLLAPYAAGADAEAFAPVAATAVVLLRFVAVYSLFDMMNVIFAAGLKGAGDTAFPLAATLTLSWGVMVVPSWLLCVRGDGGIYAAWTAASAYVFCIGCLMLARFRGGRWKKMRVIEPAPPDLAALPESA
jgi:MATE family multidrug resistance protein